MDVANRVGFYTDEAMPRPVGITRHGTTRVAMLSRREYERLKRRNREVIKAKDLDGVTLGRSLPLKSPKEPNDSTTSWTSPQPTDALSYLYPWAREANAGLDEDSK